MTKPHRDTQVLRIALRVSAFVALVSALMVGVGSAGARVTAAEQNLTKVRIGVPTTIVTGAPYLADKWGYFRREGIQPEFIVGTTGQLLTQGMLAGDIDIVVSSFIVPMQLREAGQPSLRLIAGTCNSQTNGLVVPTNSPIRQLSDIRGKRLGVAALGSSAQLLAGALLTQAGFSASDVTYIPVGTGAPAVAAFRRGLVDALYTSDPAIQILRLSGEGRLVLDLRRGQGGAISKIPSVASFTTVPFIQRNLDIVHKYVRAISRTVKRMHDRPKQAAIAYNSLAQFRAVGGGSRVARSAVLGMASCFSPYITREQVQSASTVYQRVGILKQTHTWDQVIGKPFIRDWDARY